MALGSLYACALQNGVLLPKCSKTYAINCHWESHQKLVGPHSRVISRNPTSSTSTFLSLSQCSLFSAADCCQKTEWVSCRKGKTSDFVDIQKPNSFLEGEKFQLNHVIEAQQFDREILSAIFEVAREMEKIEKTSLGASLLKGYLMATLFYEPSTRTRLSFESAMKRLGGEVLTTENAREFSSASKGETLEDTIRTVEGYSDIIVMRHFERGAAIRAASTATIPVINAGDGPGEHPTQALLDVYTIEREIGRLDGIKVGLVGDLANGRTVRSLAYLLAKYQDVKIYFVAPDVVKMKDDIKNYLTSKGVEWEESADLMEVASKCDVVYQTRIQRERFGDRLDLYDKARGKYTVDKKVMGVLQKHSVIMHPLPRLDEITVDVDDDPRAAYFRQAKNGLFIRMALLKLLLLGW
ncbi:aspartate carbamoyltransferase, chloroplastic isoform X1 [Nymphaea colorata]|nr:aspartate carbamoyltransferase, chloroplastic isoform X1 [Nymphaea colorata]XP_031489826.1 aspartate carbamoyltransferase, chloroplastic isoform X1 [Nymphaea colorata]